MKRNFLTVIVMVLGLAACAPRPDVPGSREAAYFRLADDGAVVTVSPYDGSADTLRLEKPVSRVVCM